LFSLLAVTGEAQQLVLVGPEDRLVCLEVGSLKNVVQVDDDILLTVADDYEETALVFLSSIADEGRNARVAVLR
jgi:hypothetical protein